MPRVAKSRLTYKKEVGTPVSVSGALEHVVVVFCAAESWGNFNCDFARDSGRHQLQVREEQREGGDAKIGNAEGEELPLNV